MFWKTKKISTEWKERKAQRKPIIVAIFSFWLKYKTKTFRLNLRTGWEWLDLRQLHYIVCKKLASNNYLFSCPLLPHFFCFCLHLIFEFDLFFFFCQFCAHERKLSPPLKWLCANKLLATRRAKTMNSIKSLEFLCSLKMKI